MHPLEYKIGNTMLTLSTCMGKPIRLKEVNPYTPNGKSLLFEYRTYQFPIRMDVKYILFNPFSAIYNLATDDNFKFCCFLKKITNKARYFKRIVCQQTILKKYNSLFLSKMKKDVTRFVVCCSRDWRF